MKRKENILQFISLARLRVGNSNQQTTKGVLIFPTLLRNNLLVVENYSSITLTQPKQQNFHINILLNRMNPCVNFILISALFSFFCDHCAKTKMSEIMKKFMLLHLIIMRDIHSFMVYENFHFWFDFYWVGNWKCLGVVLWLRLITNFVF